MWSTTKMGGGGYGRSVVLAVRLDISRDWYQYFLLLDWIYPETGISVVLAVRLYISRDWDISSSCWFQSNSKNY
jgi:hypothetical protein